MRAASGLAAAGVILFANAFALIHAARNTAGSGESEITLTQRELQYVAHAPSDDDSGVSLNLALQGPGMWGVYPRGTVLPDFLNANTLRKLGFDCSVDPGSPDAERFYQRQRARTAFIALEYDGPAWRAWLKSSDDTAPIERVNGARESHLMAIDADLDLRQLRSRHADRSMVIILPAVIAITVPYPVTRGRKPPENPTLQGVIRELPRSIHVPRPYSEKFPRKLPMGTNLRNNGLSYRVHLRFGAYVEPIVTGVDFTN